MVPGLFASVTRQTILWSLDCLEGRFDFDLYDGGPLRLTLFLGGFLDRFARLERFLFFKNKFLFRFLGFRECRFGRLDTMPALPQANHSGQGWCYLAGVTTLVTGRFIRRLLLLCKWEAVSAGARAGLKAKI